MPSYRPLIVLLLSLLLAACRSSDKEEEPRSTILLPVAVQIPAEEGMGQTRAMGDPGTYEKFRLPTHLYLFIVATAKDGTTRLLTFEGGGNEQALSSSAWIKTVNTSAGRPTPGDSVYRYTGNVAIEIDDDVIDRTAAARAYAAASYDDLTLSNLAPATEDDVKDITFTVAADATSQQLRDVYSTPCNLTNDAGQYYGTVQNLASNVPVVNLQLYHVASKIDVTWNVPPARQTAVRLTSVAFRNMFVGEALLFRPTESTQSPTAVTTRSVATTCDVGSQWYGRTYLYTILPRTAPGGPYFLPMTFNDTYQPTFTTQSADDRFVPWMRISLTFENIPSTSPTVEL